MTMLMNGLAFIRGVRVIFSLGLIELGSGMECEGDVVPCVIVKDDYYDIKY